MATLSALRTDLRKRFQDSNGNTLSAQPANQFINNALEDFVNRTEPMWREYGWYVTAYQQRYALPADHINIKTLHWYQNGKYVVEYIPPQLFQDKGYLNKNFASIPRHWTIIQGDIYLGPAPSASSNTSVLNGGCSATDAQIRPISPTYFQNNGGMVLVGSEQIAYQYNDGTNLTLCKRGQGGTTAAIHSSCDTVYRLDLVAVMHHTAPILTADTNSPAIDARYHRSLLHYALWEALMMDGKEEAARIEREHYMAVVKDAKREIERRQRNRLTAVRGTYQ